MKCLFIIAILLSYGCQHSALEYTLLKEENSTLKERIDSLSKELNDLKFGSKYLLEQAKTANKNGDFITAKDSLVELIRKYPASEEIGSARNLLRSITPKAENQLFVAAIKSNQVELLKKYIFQYPKGRYYSKANALLKKYERTPNLNNSSENVTTTQRRYSINKTRRIINRSYVLRERIGAICCDGTRSYATGRGACSHHGGVCEWLY